MFVHYIDSFREHVLPVRKGSMEKVSRQFYNSIKGSYPVVILPNVNDSIIRNCLRVVSDELCNFVYMYDLGRRLHLRVGKPQTLESSFLLLDRGIGVIIF